MKIAFNDKSEFTTLLVSTLDTIIVCVKDYDEVKSLQDSLYKEHNLDKILVYKNENDKDAETYEDMVLLESPLFRIIRNHTDESLYVTFGIRPMTDEERLIRELEQEDAQANESVSLAISYLSDEQALTVKELYPEYDPNSKEYKSGDRVNYDTVLYKCLTDHTSQEGWEPGVAPSLWAKILIPDPEEIPEWEQPESTNGYSAGDKVTHNEKTWESLADNNVWEPGAVGTESLWREVVAEEA